MNTIIIMNEQQITHKNPISSSDENNSSATADVIYLDAAARTRIDLRVLDAVNKSYLKHYSDPQNKQHILGQQAAEAILDAQLKIGESIGGNPQAIVFAGGAAEANNLAIFGAARAAPEKRHIITFETEPPSVFAPCKLLESEFGYTLSVLSVDSSGQVDNAEVMRCITDDTLFVSLSYINKEIGTIQDIAAISSMTQIHGALLHSDCSLALGRTPIDVKHQLIDLLTISGHKIHGPYGAGFVWARPDIAFIAASGGRKTAHGTQSYNLDVPNIVGLGLATELACSEVKTTASKLHELTIHLKNKLHQAISNLHIVTPEDNAVPGILYLSIEGIESNDLIAAVDGVAFSAGLASSIGKTKPDRLNRALSLPPEAAHNYIRLSPDKNLTLELINTAVARLADGVKTLRLKR